MSDLTTVLYFYVCGAVILLMGLGLTLAVFMPSIDRWSKRFFIVFFSVLLLNSCISFVGMVFRGVAEMLPLEVVANFWVSVLTVVPLPMLTVFLLHSAREDWRRSRLSHAVAILFALYVALVVIAQFTTEFYYITPDSQLHLGPWYPLAIAPLVTIELLNLVALVRRRHTLTRRRFVSILVALLPLTVALNVHLFVSVFPFIEIGVAIFALSMYGIILADQIECHLRQQREIAHQSANIMVLQMRPHFIHNTMVSIYYLCQQDPAEAQRVTLNFNTYLEKNLAALASDETIPFTDELEHTRAYLNVEQALYDEMLYVTYDTPHTSFRVPPLTLQPIVENAVKHGLDPDAEPLRISIETKQTSSGAEIVVSDNGPGFEPASDDKPHIALANIRQRLELMCGGKMTIMSREGGGTVVRLTIP